MGKKVMLLLICVILLTIISGRTITKSPTKDIKVSEITKKTYESKKVFYKLSEACSTP